MGDTVNVNFLTMRANLDARAASAHELFVEVPTLVEFKPRTGKTVAPEIYEYCSVMAEEFTQLILDWNQFHPSVDLIVRESDAFGIGFVLWPDEYDWRPKAYRRGTLRFDPDASVYIDENDVYTISDRMTAGELYDIIEDEEAAAARGWKVGNVKELLVQTFITGDGKEDEKYQVSMWESLQQMVRNNDPQFQEKQFAKVKIVHMLVREVAEPRKVSHLIISESDTNQVFLCEALNRFDDMHQVIWWLPYNYGDGYARSVRGVASFMAQHDDLSNRFLGRVFDAGFMSASLLLQPQSQGDLSRLQFIQHGQYTILPPELTAIQSTFQPQIAPLIQLRGVSESVMKNNTGLYRQHDETVERGVEKTARQVVEEVSKEARYEKAAVTHRYNQLDMFYREIMRRLTSPMMIDGEGKYPGHQGAKDFVQRCTERQVPKAFVLDWAKNTRLDATRALGLGSLGVKYDLTNQLVNPLALANMDEAGRRNAWRSWGAARVGFRGVDQYFAKANRDAVPSQEQSFAVLENNDLQEGTAVLVGNDQQHKLHLDVHLPAIAALIQATQGGQIADPVRAVQVMQLMLQHAAQHLEALAPDQSRSQYVKQVQEVLQAGQQALGQLVAAARRVQAQQQAAAQQQQQVVQDAQQTIANREFEAKVLEINRKFALKEREQESLNDMRRSKTEEQNSIRRDNAVEQARLNAEKQSEDLRQKALTAEADRRRKDAQ